MKDRKIEGYWKMLNPYFKEETDYPMPVAGVLTEQESKDIYDKIVEKEKTATVQKYRGWTTSRITGESLGNAEYHTDEWIWPGDFAKHYVLENGVRPTNEFLKYIGYE